LQDMIKARAARLGFSFTGFAPALQTPHFSQYFDFISTHELGDLNFLSKEYVIQGREDPGTLLENGRTMIVLGSCYPPQKAPEWYDYPSDGIVSAYARFPDYHHVIRKNAETLMDDLQNTLHIDFQWRIFIDSGPVMEKDMAYSAGIGWIGKNSLCIHPVHGSFFFICCILTDLDITESQPAPIQDLCGDCSACINACPAKCIHDHSIDITRCIAYLTIEHKGVIPRELRTVIGPHIFGCDVCQSVCPYNLHRKKMDSAVFFGRQQLIHSSVSLNHELALSPPSFIEKFTGTPIIRIGFEQYLRNVIIAAGNTKENHNLQELKQLANHSSKIIALHAIWAIGQYRNEDGNKFLSGLLKENFSGELLEEIRIALHA